MPRVRPSSSLTEGELLPAIEARASLEEFCADTGISRSTVYRADQGRPLTRRVMRAIRDWLTSHPESQVMAGMVARPERRA